MSRFTTFLVLIVFGQVVFNTPLAIAVPQSNSHQATVTSQQIQDFQTVAKADGYSDAEIQRVIDGTIINQAGMFTLNYQPNGCSNPLPGSSYNKIFVQACDQHDYCYSAEYNRGRSRKTCDEIFRSRMRMICNGRFSGYQNTLCLRESQLWYYAVRTFGRSHFKGSGDPS